MKKWEIGDTFEYCSPFTGGECCAKIIEVQQDKIVTISKRKELDGVHSIKEEYKFNEQQQYIVLYECFGREAKLFKEKIEEEVYEKSAYEAYENCCPSATNGDYSPSNPWDAPGMSIRDFI